MNLRSGFGDGRLIVRPLPGSTQTGRLMERLVENQAPLARRPVADLNIVAERFIASIVQKVEPAVSDWNRIAWCLWTTRPAIAEHDEALEALLGRVATMRRRRPYGQLAAAYLADFAPNRPRLDRIAAALAAHATRAGDPWARAQTNHGIFDSLRGADRIARAALNGGTSIWHFLQSVGLGSHLLEAGFAQATHNLGLGLIRDNPAAAADRLEVVRRWCLRDDGSLVFADCRAEMARTIVLPFRDRTPDASDRDRILDFLVGRFGDPRVNQGAWIGMDDVAAIVTRWLAEQSLRQFFDVLDTIAQPSHWRYRRAFWEAYFDHQPPLIRNAWVVFGPDGATRATRAFGRNVRFAVFRPGGRKQVLRGHGVLLMDMGQCIVADWSHNGVCTIWPTSDRSRPALNGDAYTTDEVGRRTPRDRSESNLNRHDMFSHDGSESYLWQNRVAARLHELIGVRVRQDAYRVH